MKSITRHNIASPEENGALKYTSSSSGSDIYSVVTTIAASAMATSTTPSSVLSSNPAAAHAAAAADPHNASISIRSYIYFLPYPMPPDTPIPYTPGLPSRNPLNYPPTPFEPTHTLVLTSSSKSFVDIRILRPLTPHEPELPNNGGPRARLDWAFAGTASSVPVSLDPAAGAQRGYAGPVMRATWTHWLDSRHPVGTPPERVPLDTGLMFPLSAEQTLEHGSAPNPLTGAMQSYEELWTDLPILPCFPATSKVCVVLRLDCPEHAVRGLVIRLGSYCQGIAMKDGYATVERWEFKDEDDNGTVVGGEWERTVRIGDQFVPCAAAMKPEVLTIGGLVKYVDYEWVVEEIAEWSD